MINNGVDPYAVNDCVIAFPIPAECPGDSGLRGALVQGAGTAAATVGCWDPHSARAGKAAPVRTRQPCCMSVCPDFRSPTGEIWAVHTAWSGNHTHYAERVFTGVTGHRRRRTAAARRDPAAGQRYLPHSRGSTARTGRASMPWHGRFHRFLRARETHPSPTRPVTLNVWEAVYFGS